MEPKNSRLDSAATSPYATAPSSPRGRRLVPSEGAAGSLFLTAPPSPNPLDLLPPATPRLTGTGTGAANPFDLFQHFTSAPASPRRAAAIYARFAEGNESGGDDDGDGDGDEEFQPRRTYAAGGSSVPFDWEERPGTPKRGLGGAGAGAGAVAADEAAWATEFEFGKAAPAETLTTADELFEKGKIRASKPTPKTADEPKVRPLKPPPGLLDGGSVPPSPMGVEAACGGGAERAPVSTSTRSPPRCWRQPRRQRRPRSASPGNRPRVRVPCRGARAPGGEGGGGSASATSATSSCSGAHPTAAASTTRTPT